ncbi:hypothetical protein [Streptomyces californicus]|uniref:hypothetical protein n=1 Tax=Streptomyces californicus TaxID=67351 RepID=UPI003721F467
MTVPEIRQLCTLLIGPPTVTAAGLLHWSIWRRHHQADSPTQPRRTAIHRRSGRIDHNIALEC